MILVIVGINIAVVVVSLQPVTVFAIDMTLIMAIYTVVIITSNYEMRLTSLWSYPETFFTLFSLLKRPNPQHTDKRYLT